MALHKNQENILILLMLNVPNGIKKNTFFTVYIHKNFNCCANQRNTLLSSMLIKEYILESKTEEIKRIFFA